MRCVGRILWAGLALFLGYLGYNVLSALGREVRDGEFRFDTFDIVALAVGVSAAWGSLGAMRRTIG